MNSSKYMDKRITQLSNSLSRSVLDDGEEEDDEDNSFNFHPIRPLQSRNRALDGTQGWSSLDGIDSTKPVEKVQTLSDVALISKIDQILKDHADVFLHSVECLSARVSQMEYRTHLLESAFDDLKSAVEFNHAKTNGKLREMENILMAVQGSVQDLRDNQDIAEAQMQLAKLRGLKDDPQLEKRKTTDQGTSSREALPLFSQQSHQPPVPVACPQLAVSSTLTNLPLQSHSPTTALQLPTPGATLLPVLAVTAPELSTPFPQNIVPFIPQQESRCQMPLLAPETRHQQYLVPPPAHQHHQPVPPHVLNSQLSQLSRAHPPFAMANSQVHYPLSHHPEEVPYMPSDGIHKSSQPPGKLFPSQQYNMGPIQYNQSQPSNRQYSESNSATVQPHGQADTTNFHRYGAPTHKGGAIVKPLQSSSPPLWGGETGHSELPTARVLPHAIPTASSVDASGGSGSGRSANRVPVDDVVDNVVAMGFRRDLVRATVKKLTENGQAVDLNVVLDKLMNNG